MTEARHPTFQCTASDGKWSYLCPYCNEVHSHKPYPGMRCAHCRAGTPLYLKPIYIKLAPAAKASAEAEARHYIQSDSTLRILLKSSGLSRNAEVIAAIVAAAGKELETSQETS